MAKQKRRSKARRKPKDLKTALMQWGVGLVTAVLALVLGVTLTEGETGYEVWRQLQQLLGFESTVVPVRPTAGDTALHFIDVGQGDAVLIEHNGEFCLIDAGTRECETDLLNYLDNAGVDRIKLMVMTHPHADHIGSMRAVLRHVPVEQVLLPDLAKADAAPSHTLERVLEEIAAQKLPTVTAAPGQSYAIGGGTLSVLAAGVNTRNYNDISPVLRFDGQGLSFLNTGDGEVAVEEDALAAGLDLSATVFKAGHHGSRTSNTPAFLRAVGPEYVVISCGQGNSYGHPNTEALEAYAAVNAQVYRTDQLGSVVILGTPQGVEVHTDKNRQEGAEAA